LPPPISLMPVIVSVGAVLLREMSPLLLLLA
jgi:hypothetical protein